MEIVHKNEANKIRNGDNCLAFEYPFSNNKINCAIIEIRGRYPENGAVANQICYELCYVQAGQGTLVIDGKKVQLATGDMVMIEPKEKFYWDGNLDLAVSCTPSWTPDQYKKFN